MPDEESRPVKGVSCVVRSVGSTCTRPREEDQTPGQARCGSARDGQAAISPPRVLPGYGPGACDVYYTST